MQIEEIPVPLPLIDTTNKVTFKSRDHYRDQEINNKPIIK